MTPVLHAHKAPLTTALAAQMEDTFTKTNARLYVRKGPMPIMRITAAKVLSFNLRPLLTTHFVVCDSACATCNSKGNLSCTSCLPDKHLHGAECKSKCPQNTYSNDDSSDCLGLHIHLNTIS